ncbi:MAG: AAA family ATPase [Cytophagales bacterium]|nr:AAA family ATPase [Cytophagales bacterium]
MTSFFMFELQEIAELAAKYVNTTDRHIFLTGKAGTGKTTFLKYIMEHTYKNAVVAAPTGIAAINAGGVTLHSLLQLPFGTFIPENVPPSSSDTQINTPATLFRETRFNASKRQLIRELELLIIDEVSMLRADLLDCIDHTLRYLRKRKYEPFGGLQILFIGDLLQLPPVVKDQDAELLKPYYSSNYFFEARALKEQAPIRVELEKIYRQTDQDFIDLLNRLRNNEQTEEDISLLNRHYDPSLNNDQMEGYIHLTTHNMKADRFNEMRLQNLDGEVTQYKANISTDFPENMYPTVQTLTLKEGAQVMFLKNDPSGQGQFFNGKIGMVTRLDEDAIWVKCEDGSEINVETYEWEHKRYVLNSNQEIEEKHIGNFEQYPLKLAWAVTIHKSQGLTFEKAILDLTGSFAPGQLYVALSRLTSMRGLVLSSPLPENPPDIDPSLKEFVRTFQPTEELEEKLQEDRRNYLLKSAKLAFGFETLLRELSYHERSFNKEENRSLKQKHLQWTKELISDTFGLKPIGETFIKQVAQILGQGDYIEPLSDRMDKAQAYFEPQIAKLAGRLDTQLNAMKGVKNVKTYIKELKELITLFRNQNKQILKLTMLVREAGHNKVLTREQLRETSAYKDAATSAKATSKKRKKDQIPTATISYDLYKQGKTVEEIAEHRGFVKGTIEGHLATFVESGHLDVNDFIKPKRLEKILEIYNKGITNSGEIKSQLGEDFTYTEIKLAQAYASSLEVG